MTEPIFFEIPIYRCRLEQHSAEMKKLEEKWTVEEYKERLPYSYQLHRQFFEQQLWYPWRYNEIIGYGALYIMGSQSRADEWFVTKQRINKGITAKEFRHRRKVLEKAIPRNESSENPFRFILDALEYLNKKEYPKRFPDTSTFKIAGRFIDWKKLTTQLNTFSHPEIRDEYFRSY